MAAVVGRGCASLQTSQHMPHPVITNSAVLLLRLPHREACYSSRTRLQLQVINNTYCACFERDKRSEVQTPEHPSPQPLIETDLSRRSRKVCHGSCVLADIAMCIWLI